MPLIPNFEGLDSFQGTIFHSARWPAEADLRGKRVAVIGTGASAMQIVPSIVGEVRELVVLQRTPQWIAPAELISAAVPREFHWLVDNAPFYQRWYRFRQAWNYNDKNHAALQIDPDWEHPERSVSAANDGHRRYFTRYILDQLEGHPDLQAKAVPSYPPFEKRILLDWGWYEALKKPHVHLVADGLSRLTPTGLITESGDQIDADVIVLCTGFRARTPLYPMEIRGRDGRSVRDLWGEDNPRAYLGTTVNDFPNLFLVRGPNTTPGGGSSTFITECQVRYITRLIAAMVEHGYGELEVKAEVEERYNASLDRAHAGMIWTHPGTETYYRNTQGRVVVNMPWRVVDFWKMTRETDLDNYEVTDAREALRDDAAREAALAAVEEAG
jgi:4-hydroxyacetophenone monooxygenase